MNVCVLLLSLGVSNAFLFSSTGQAEDKADIEASGIEPNVYEEVAAGGSLQLEASPGDNEIEPRIAHHQQVPSIRSPTADNLLDPIVEERLPTTDASTRGQAGLQNATEESTVEERALSGGNHRRERNHHCHYRRRRVSCYGHSKGGASSTLWPIPVPATYGPTYRPLVPEVKLFLCNFENHACGMRNQPMMGHYFYRVASPLAGRGGHYMAVDARQTGHGVSRLITPYLPGYPNATACLRLHFIIAGPGASKIQVIAQDKINRPLFILQQDADRWEEFSVDMDVPQDVRFFIEAHTTDKGSGVIGIDNLLFHFGHCRHSDIKSRRV